MRVIFIQPMFFPPGQETLVNELPTHRNTRCALETKIRFITEFVFRLDLFDNDDVLYADAKISIVVVTRLVRDHITGGQWNL